jgi:hypothetical protein
MENWRRGKKSLAVLSIRSNGSLCRRDDRGAEGGCPSSESEDHHPLYGIPAVSRAAACTPAGSSDIPTSLAGAIELLQGRELYRLKAVPRSRAVSSDFRYGDPLGRRFVG